MSEFRFANPDWIHAVWIVLLVAATLVALELRGRSMLDQLLSRVMQTRLVHRTSRFRRMTAIVLATLAMLLLVLALMRPQWGRTVERTVRIDAQIMICLDVSKSMLAEDVAPNRLERAKVELDSLLGLMRDGQQVGLIAFAGKAAVLCPMTTDFGFLRLVLADAEPQSVGLGGTKIGTAVQTALDGFREAGDIHRMILLITDGEDHESFPLDAARRAKENGVRIVAVGFGDEAGSKIEITDPKTGVRSFLKDRNGKDVVSHLDGDTLRQIALNTDGAYVPAGTGALDLESIYHSHIKSLLHGSLDSQQRVIRNEAFQWFVLAGAILLIMTLVTSTPWNLRARALRAVQTMATPTATSPKRSTTSAMTWWIIALALSFSAHATNAQQPNAQRLNGPVNAAQQALTAKTVSPTATVPTAKDQANHDSESTPHSQPNGSQTAANSTPSKNEAFDKSLPPRTLYNQAVALVRADPDRAEKILNYARSEAGADGELRFRTLYNLGWVEVSRADTALQKEPEQALQHLHQAANRFREAVRVRPEDSAARQNLEIVSRRILELTDALRKKDPQDLTARLDQLVTQSREHQGELQSLVQQLNAEDAPAAHSFRSNFRQIAVTQRQLISDTQQFLDDARTQLDALAQKSKDEKTQEDKVRAVQLENMLGYVDRSIQRMNKARSQTRRLQGDSAFRHWAAALSDLKRARDQLRNPVEVLGQMLADATELANFARMLANSKLPPRSEETPDQPPAWVTTDYLADLLIDTKERTTELEQMFTHITAAQKEIASKQGEEPAKAAKKPEPPDPKTAQLLQQIKMATPLVRNAQQQFEQARKELENKTLDAAHEDIRQGIVELSKAWELFFDIRRLIELIYGNQQMVQRALEQAAQRPEIANQLKDPLVQAEQTNLQRCERLAALLQFEQHQLPPEASSKTNGPAFGPATPPGTTASPANAPPGQGADEQEAAAKRQQFELAEQLLKKVIADITQAKTHVQNDILPGDGQHSAQDDTPSPDERSAESESDRAEAQSNRTNADKQPDEHSGTETHDNKTGQKDKRANQLPNKPDAAPTPATAAPAPAASDSSTTGPFHEAGVSVERSITSLEELRRLFFSLVEHLRDTARRQADLNDETTTLSAAASTDKGAEKTGPFALRQQQLQNIAKQIATALQQQADQAATAADQQAAAPSTSNSSNSREAATAEKLAQAADLVDSAQHSMQTAAEQLMAITQEKSSAEKPFNTIQENQVQSLQELIEALTLLDKQDQNQDQQKQDQEQQQDQQQKQEQQQQQKMDANQLLQLIRDREAKRRKDKKQRAAASGSAVDKDW